MSAAPPFRRTYALRLARSGSSASRARISLARAAGSQDGPFVFPASKRRQVALTAAGAEPRKRPACLAAAAASGRYWTARPAAISGHPAVRAGPAADALDLFPGGRSLARSSPPTRSATAAPARREPSALTSTSAPDCQVPSARVPDTTGSRVNGATTRAGRASARARASRARVASARRQAGGRRAPQSGRRRCRPRATSPRPRPSRTGRTRAAARRPRPTPRGALRGDLVHRLAAARPHVGCHGFHAEWLTPRRSGSAPAMPPGRTRRI